jgi:hypothetical protein
MRINPKLTKLWFYLMMTTGMYLFLLTWYTVVIHRL